MVKANETVDTLTRDLTAFGFFKEMVEETFPTYRPTIQIRDGRYLRLALAYNAAQQARGDRRRAYTGNSMPQVGDRVRFYAFGAIRVGRIEKVGVKLVTVSYTSKAQRDEAKATGFAPRRYQRQLRLDRFDTLNLGGDRTAWEVR